MELTVIGSANASNAAGRAHSCYWLDGVTPQGLMVDFGATALMALQRCGRRSDELGVLAFTHLHGDHIGGFPYFLIDAIYTATPRQAPLHVVGPLGLEERLRELLRVTYGTLAEKQPSFALRYTELAPGDELQLEGARLKAFAADHQDPPEQPLCLRITAASGQVVAFSGDTQPCEGLRQAAQGADLLVAECTGLAPPIGRHTSWEDWLELLATIGAQRVLLSHLGADVRAKAPELLLTAPAGVRLDFADDGLRLPL